MNLALLTWLVEQLGPHVLVTALVLARLAPFAFLCPLLGGNAAPVPTRLGLCLALGLFVRFAGGVEVPAGVDADVFTVGAAFFRELLCGAAMGFVAALPFDAARMGGRFLDTFRGANAEATLPATGSKEAATGDLLYQLLCAIAFAGFTYRIVLGALLTSFRASPPGLPAMNTGLLLETAVVEVGSALAAGLAIGAPAAAVSLLIDCALGVASRAAPQLCVRELGSPAKLLLGAAAIYASLGTVSSRLLEHLAGTSAAMRAAGAAFGAGP